MNIMDCFGARGSSGLTEVALNSLKCSSHPGLLVRNMAALALASFQCFCFRIKTRSFLLLDTKQVQSLSKCCSYRKVEFISLLSEYKIK